VKDWRYMLLTFTMALVAHASLVDLSSFSRCLVTPLSLFSSVAWRVTRRARSQPRSLKSPQSMKSETGLEPMDVEVTDLDSMDVGVAKIDAFGALDTC
jgi:hypothetical protein